MTTTRYLEGNFAPVRTEETLTELDVSGTLPARLDGRYLRNGPNPVVDPDPATYHWFTGDGMVHGIRLRDGRAEWYLEAVATVHAPVRVPFGFHGNWIPASA